MKAFLNRVAILILLCSPLLIMAAHEILAQQAPDPQASATACVGKLGEEIQSDLQMRVIVYELQKQVQDLQDQLKAAKAKK